MTVGREYIPGLGIVRFLAAVFVMFNHLATYSSQSVQVATNVAERAFPLLFGFETVGAVGVEIFFVISGFVIAFSASRRIGGHGAVAFSKARLLRVIPALWISSGVALCALWTSGWPVSGLLPRLAMSMLLSPKGPYLDGVIWTLLVEVMFYTLVAISIWRFNPAPLRNVAVTLGVVSCLFLSLFLLAFLMDWLAVLNNMHWFGFTFFLGRHGVFFAIGILLWSIKFEQTERLNVWMIMFTGFAIVELWFAMHQNWANLFCALALCCLAFFMIGATESWRCTCLDRWLGDLSYPLYLNHYSFGMCVTAWLAAEGRSEIIHLVLTVAAIFAVSISVLYLEKALRRRLQPRGIFKTIVRLPLT